jgi:hypothetical protein
VNAYYERDGDTWIPSGLCRGPWSSEHLHGGPPAALLTRALERWGDDAGNWVLTRLTAEILRPIPFRPCKVEVTPRRLGRRVQRLGASLLVDGEPLLQISALRARRLDLDLPPAPGEDKPNPAPTSCPPFSFDFFPWEEGYHRSFDARLIGGTWGFGPVSLWTRLLVDVVAGESASPWQRVVAIADAESGIAPPLDPRRWAFLNPDLTVALHREPRGPWIGVAAQSRVDAQGTGLSESRLFDDAGTFGRAAQTLLVEPRNMM